MNTALPLPRTLGEVAAACHTDGQIAILAAEAERLSGMAEQEPNGAAIDRVRNRAAELRRLLEAGPGAIDERQAEWLGGTA